MIAAVLLALIAVLYRVIIGVAGMHEMNWLHNFSPLAAIALCGAIYFPRRVAVLAPLVAFLVSDLILNASYGVPLISVRMLPEYIALGFSAALGWKLRANPRPARIFGASLLGSIAFYVITNTGDWIADPGYVKNAAGWVQALTTGLPAYPSTITFLRNTVASDLLFTAMFVACMAWKPRTQTAPHAEFATR